MSLLDDVERLIREDRLAHAYIVQGDPRGDGKDFATQVVMSLFRLTSQEEPENIRHRIEGRLHPDVTWVEPASKLRQITVEALQPAMRAISEKSFEGGWKAVVFLYVERMNDKVANRFLKTLEEPPPKTLLLLVTALPEQLLDTIRSRCQFLLAPRGPIVRPEWEADLLDLLREGPPRNLMSRLVRAASLRNFLENLGKVGEGEGDEEEEDVEEGEDEHVDDKVRLARDASARLETWQRVMESVEAWYRDLLVLKTGGQSHLLHYPQAMDDLRRQAEGLDLGAILKLLENVRDAARRLSTNLPLQVVMESAVF
jgi:DNA polymerase-3 subunit delta'